MTLLQEIYIEYMIAYIYSYRIKIIQKYYRWYRFLLNLRKKIHQYKSKEYLEDIIEIAYLPPMRESDIPIVRKGGFHYREGLRNFNKLLKLNF